MCMTSVSGHLLNNDIEEKYHKWYSCAPSQLFELPVLKTCKTDSGQAIKRTLERESRRSQWLIVWTDCDREGENIGFEIIEVCQAAKPSLRVFRAKFSEITRRSVDRALETLGQPGTQFNRQISRALRVRQQQKNS